MTTSNARAVFLSILGVTLWLGVVTLVCPDASAEPAGPTLLDPKTPIERELGAGETHVYEILVPPGKVVIGVVEQRGVDLVLRVVDPSGKLVTTVDSPNGTNGPEPWTILPEPSGRWRIEVAALAAGGTGRYEVSISETITTEERAERQARLRYRSPRLFRLWKELRRDGGALDTFSAEMKGHAPLVEPIEGDPRGDVLVTFLLRNGQTKKQVWLYGGPAGDFENPMLRFEDADLWYLTLRAPKDLRVSYGFRVGDPLDAGMPTIDEWVAFVGIPSPDPWNPLQTQGMSLLELPGAPAQPWVEPRNGVAAGRVVQATIKSQVLGEDRAVAVYLPAGFDPAHAPYPFVVLFDGESYGLAPGAPVPTPVILDNLIAERRIPPMLGVLVANQGTRNRDLAMSATFCEFLAKELAPWLRREHRASDAAADATIAGASLGGLEACYCAFHHSDTFGNVLSQSGAFQFNRGDFERSARYAAEPGEMIREVRDAERKTVRFWMEAGLFEGGPGWTFGSDLLAQNRHLRDVLMLKGYDVSYHEFARGHDWASWRGSLADGLIALVGTASEGGR